MFDGDTTTSSWRLILRSILLTPYSCGVDHPGGDMLVLVTATFSDCMDACADWNNRRGSGQPHCDGIAAVPVHWPTVTNQDDGSCYLKSGVTSSSLASNPGNSNIDFGIITGL